MMFKQSLLAVSVCLMAANAHLFISSPKPIAGTAIKDPLQPDGSNFPCHGVALPGSGGQSMAVGSQQKLVFDAGMPATQNPSIPWYQGGQNTAVHGGGSCQISITYETDPHIVKEPSAWKVIYSIEGGCPTNSGGNLEGSYTGPLGDYRMAIPCSDPHADGTNCINDFNFTIPEGVKNGQATLAWTWYNTIGNREIYMNCVAVDITGGSDDSTMSDFPDIYAVNIGALGGYEVTVERTNVKFPKPGKYVTTKTATTTYMLEGTLRTVSNPTAYSIVEASTILIPAGAGPKYSASSFAAVPTSYAAGSSSSSYAPAPSSYAATPSSHAATPSSYAAATTMATLPSVVLAPTGTGYLSYISSNSNLTSGACSTGKVSCPSPGELMCIDESTFGICDIDNCAVPRVVAPGTSCSNNIVAKRDVVRRRASRIHRHIPGHVHKHGF